MTRGIQAAVWIIAAMLAVALVAGLGFYEFVGVKYATQDDDTNRIIDALEDPSGSGASGQGVVESFTSGAIDVATVLWIAISDTSEVVMLFIPFQPIADTVETMARLAMGLFILQLMRGVVFS